MSIENNFFATDSCEWSNANYSECLCPLPQCPVSHFRFLSACRDDLDWKLHDSRIVPPPWSRLTFLPRLAVTWMLVWHPLTIRPTLNQGSSYFPAAVTLLVLYSPAQSVLRLHWDFRDGVWIVYGLLDCVSFVQIDKLFDCWSHVSNLPFTYINIWQLLTGVSMWPPSKKGGEGGCYKVVSTDNMNKNCKGDNLGVFFVILTAASWLVDRIAVYPLTSG